MSSRIANFTLYPIGWIACVLGASSGRPWLGAGVAMGGVLLHLLLARRPVELSRRS